MDLNHRHPGSGPGVLPLNYPAVAVGSEGVEPFVGRPTCFADSGFTDRRGEHRPDQSVAQVGLEPTASLVLSEGGLPALPTGPTKKARSRVTPGLQGACPQEPRVSSADDRRCASRSSHADDRSQRSSSSPFRFSAKVCLRAAVFFAAHGIDAAATPRFREFRGFFWRC